MMRLTPTDGGSPADATETTDDTEKDTLKNETCLKKVLDSAVGCKDWLGTLHEQSLGLESQGGPP
jgi:hypothetical protein